MWNFCRQKISTGSAHSWLQFGKVTLTVSEHFWTKERPRKAQHLMAPLILTLQIKKRYELCCSRPHFLHLRSWCLGLYCNCCNRTPEVAKEKLKKKKISSCLLVAILKHFYFEDFIKYYYSFELEPLSLARTTTERKDTTEFFKYE
ncbi:hypothetical protein J6590_030203 [Homalodisca vitripennis]|nr:hypothetical protein J6590_030203 [Homalodisca vitripennis]